MSGITEKEEGHINDKLAKMSEESEDYHTITYNHDLDYGFSDLNKTDQLDYDNPFNVPAVRITFILLYSLVFACCFFGKS